MLVKKANKVIGLRKNKIKLHKTEEMTCAYYFFCFINESKPTIKCSHADRLLFSALISSKSKEIAFILRFRTTADSPVGKICTVPGKTDMK